MSQLKLTAVPDERPVRLTIELAAETHRMLLAYAEAYARQSGQEIEPHRLIGPMLARFMGSDRAFVRGRGRQGA
jgi:hypothetical protein